MIVTPRIQVPQDQCDNVHMYVIIIVRKYNKMCTYKQC